MQGSISRLIEPARAGDPTSLELLFKRFRNQLISWANRKLHPDKCRDFDAEDIAVESFHAFYLGFTEGKYPEVKERDSLQALLATITIRKAINSIEKANTIKRGEGKIHGESIDLEIDSFTSRELRPDEQAILDDEIEFCLETIPDELKEIVKLTLIGMTSSEIAQEFHCSTRSIQLKKKRLRTLLYSK